MAAITRGLRRPCITAITHSGRGSKGARHIPVPHRQRLAPTLARYKARSQSAPAADTAEITFGSFLERIDPRSKGYATAFRKIVADLFGLATDPAKFDYQSGGRDEWLAKIHGIRLSEVTPAKVQEWKQSFLAAAGDDPLALRKARISVNTLLRRSRSLFSRKVLRQLPLRLPSPLPFDGVEFEPRQSMKYRSNFNVLDLIKLANKELRPSDPPVYMIFLLGVAAGLRRKEIDLLEWSAFRFKENAIRVEPTQFFHPKSQDSIAEVQVDPESLSVEEPGDGTELEVSEDPVIQQLFDELGRALIAYWNEYPNWIREPPAFLFKALNQLFIS